MSFKIAIPLIKRCRPSSAVIEEDPAANGAGSIPARILRTRLDHLIDNGLDLVNKLTQSTIRSPLGADPPATPTFAQDSLKIYRSSIH